jgi:hypothetical protein
LLVAAAVICGWRYVNRETRIPLSHREIATRVLAEYLSSNRPTAKVIVFSNPFTQMNGRPAQIYAFEKAGLEGLRKGFGSKTELRIVFPKLRPEAIQNPQSVNMDSRSKTPLSFMVEANAFGELLRKNHDCELALTLIGVPLNFQTLPEWTKPGPPRFALLLPDWRMIGDSKAVEAAFHNGKLGAAVVAKPGGAPEDAPATSDYRSEFEKRFILVTKANISSLLSKNPDLFN